MTDNAARAARSNTATECQMKPVPWSAMVLLIVVVISAAAASLTTLVWRGSFPGPSPASIGNSVLAEARGWSAATLLVAIPTAIISLRAACRGSLRGRLVWLGALASFVYTYLEFAVSPTADAGTTTGIAAPFALFRVIGVMLAFVFFRSGLDAGRSEALRRATT